MISYHNDPSLKESIVAEMQKHKDHDQFVKGTYNINIADNWADAHYDEIFGEYDSIFKGCAVGCAIDSFNIKLGKSYTHGDHRAFEEAIGVPAWLAHLQDKLFEMLPSGEDSQFAVDFLEAIPVGIDLEPVRHKFCAFLMKENIKIVSNLNNIPDELRKEVLDAIQQVLQLHENKDSIIDEIACSTAHTAARKAMENAVHKEKYGATYEVISEARKTSFAASSAAYSISYSAAYTPAACIPISVANSVANSVAAASSAAYSAAQKYAAQLLTLLKNEI